MKASTMNTVARSINARRNSFGGIVSDFRAAWGKVYRAEVTTALNDVVERIHAGEDLRAERYSLECVLAKMKSLTLSDEEKQLIESMHEELTFSCLSMDFITERLEGLNYVLNGDCYEQKKNKETGEKEWKPVEKWTVMKVGRYFRLAAIANEK